MLQTLTDPNQIVHKNGLGVAQSYFQKVFKFSPNGSMSPIYSYCEGKKDLWPTNKSHQWVQLEDNWYLTRLFRSKKTQYWIPQIGQYDEENGNMIFKSLLGAHAEDSLKKDQLNVKSIEFLDNYLIAKVKACFQPIQYWVFVKENDHYEFYMKTDDYLKGANQFLSQNPDIVIKEKVGYHFKQVDNTIYLNKIFLDKQNEGHLKIKEKTIEQFYTPYGLGKTQTDYINVDGLKIPYKLYLGNSKIIHDKKTLIVYDPGGPHTGEKGFSTKSSFFSSYGFDVLVIGRSGFRWQSKEEEERIDGHWGEEAKRYAKVVRLLSGGYSQIVGIGDSFGGWLMTRLASIDPHLFDQIIVQDGCYDIGQDWQHMLEGKTTTSIAYFAPQFGIQWGKDNAQKLQKLSIDPLRIKIPAHIFVNQNDNNILPEQGKNFYEKLIKNRQKAELHILNGGHCGSNDLQSRREYLDEVLKILGVTHS